MFAIIDIETTGGNSATSRITEVAIFLFDGTKIIDEFTSLINPECHIPPYITSLTGISNQMVANAPRFHEVARQIVEITEGATFVAHNVPFDYRFIQTEFKRLGYDYIRDTLCTVKLSRKHIPGYPSYSLGNICANLGISINGRHRAAGDALATVKLFEKILAASPNLMNEQQEILQTYAPHLSSETLNQLPQTTGIYYLHNPEGEIIYIGKSVNIRKRVLDHTARPKTKRATEMLSQIAHISFESTGSETIALIAEADAIKKHMPKFNVRGRRKKSLLGIFTSTDTKGFINLNIESISKNEAIPIATFEKQADAQSFLYRTIEQYELCQKLCGLYSSNGACFQHQIGQCKGACIGAEPSSAYNHRVKQAIVNLGLGSKSFFLIDDGRHSEEHSFIKISNGKVDGYGYFDPNYINTTTHLLSVTLIPCGNHREGIMAIRNAISKGKGKVIEVEK